MMKWIIALLLLVSTNVLAEDCLYEYDIDTRKKFLKWYPVLSINYWPYWYMMYNNDSGLENTIWDNDVGGGLQFGVRYDFDDDRGYLEFKQEYATMPISSYEFIISDEEPIIIFEFHRSF